MSADMPELISAGLLVVFELPHRLAPSCASVVRCVGYEASALVPASLSNVSEYVRSRSRHSGTSHTHADLIEAAVKNSGFGNDPTFCVAMTPNRKICEKLQTIAA